MFNIVLLEPEIASNTGNIGRTCLATGSKLHLIEPLGFQLTEKKLLRAGMDYWDQIEQARYRDWEHFLGENPHARLFFLTTKGDQAYTKAEFHDGDFLVFGKESAGIPEEILVQNHERCIRIPMAGDIRSLNLSNSVAIVLYEALRQQGFAGLEEKGQLHRLSWEKK